MEIVNWINSLSFMELYLLAGGILAVIVAVLGVAIIFKVNRRMGSGVIWLAILLAVPFVNIFVAVYAVYIAHKDKNSRAK